MFKIEFDETNPIAVSAVAQSLNVLSGNDPLVIHTESTTISNGNLSKTKTTTTAGKDVPPPDLKETPEADDNLHDSEGLPWDGRIHAKTKTKNADKSWKILRRPKIQFPTDDLWTAFIDQVKAELKASGKDDVPAGKDDVPAGKDDVPAGKDDVPPPNNFGDGTATPETENPEPAEEPMTFAKVMKVVTGSNGKITNEAFQEICDSYEIKKPADLAKVENKILLPGIYEELQEISGE